MDELLLEFIKDNLVTGSLVLAILKIIAVETPCATDDKIIELLTGFFTGKKN